MDNEPTGNPDAVTESGQPVDIKTTNGKTAAFDPNHPLRRAVRSLEYENEIRVRSRLGLPTNREPVRRKQTAEDLMVEARVAEHRAAGLTTNLKKVRRMIRDEIKAFQNAKT